MKLNVKTVASFKGPGKLSDGNNLYLTAKSATQKSWLFIYKSPVTGKQREMGLGYAGPGGVSLAEAREKATAQRKLLSAGKDPIDERLAELDRLKAEARVVPTFGEFADRYVEENRDRWRNPKHAAQWLVTVTKQAVSLRPMRLDQIDTAAIVAVVEPLWDAKRETARRTRGRIEDILDAATARGHRTGENPARFPGHLEHILSKKKQVRGHHAALAWEELPAFMIALRQREELGARLLEIGILTAARSGEVRGLTWSEIDLVKRTWSVPGDRMKAGEPHEVPLVRRAVEIFEHLKAVRVEGCDLVFPNRHGKPFSDAVMGKTLKAMGYGHVTQHGFRSTLSTWRAEATDFAYELAEMALAHKIANKVQAAYMRSNMFARRVRFMQAWADQCDGKWVNPHAEEASNVVTLSQAA